MATEIIFWGSFLLTSLLLCFFGWRTLSQGSTSSSIFGSKITYDASTHWQSSSRDHVLALLVQAGVYDEADFKNELGIVPPYWGSKTHLKPKETTTDDWGPCFAPHERVRWKQEIKKYNGTNPAFHNPARSAAATKQNKNDFASFCRPGFLIIGAGKCGTSVS